MNLTPVAVSTPLFGKNLGQNWWMGLAISRTTAFGHFAVLCDLQLPIHVAIFSAPFMRSVCTLGEWELAGRGLSTGEKIAISVYFPQSVFHYF